LAVVLFAILFRAGAKEAEIRKLGKRTSYSKDGWGESKKSWFTLQLPLGYGADQR
jgi:hypothetical protein